MMETKKLQKDKTIIKMKKEGGVYWPQNHKDIFRHCTNGANALSESEFSKFYEIFALHNVQLYF